jgi:hypothetical protein
MAAERSRISRTPWYLVWVDYGRLSLRLFLKDDPHRLSVQVLDWYADHTPACAALSWSHCYSWKNQPRLYREGVANREALPPIVRTLSPAPGGHD